MISFFCIYLDGIHNGTKYGQKINKIKNEYRFFLEINLQNKAGRWFYYTPKGKTLRFR